MVGTKPFRPGCALLPLAVLAGSDLTAIEAPDPQKLDWRLDGPGEYRQGIVTAGSGFVLRGGNLVLIGNALRWNQPEELIFAQGQVVLAMPGLRVEAAELGYDGRKRSGEAWNVLITLTDPPAPHRHATTAKEESGPPPVDRRPRFHAAYCRFDPTAVILDQVLVDSGHGGVAEVTARQVVIGRRPEAAPDRSGAARHLEDITFWGTRVEVWGLPVFWSPVLYRDFTIDWPWTRYEGGFSRRLGLWVRGRIGWKLPAVAGWHTKILGEVGHWSESGSGAGTGLRWWHQDWGQGEAHAFAAPLDRVEDPETRSSALLLDAEHRAAIPGGGFSARYTALPDPADPRSPDRFRMNYHPEDVEERPFARQGAAVAWSDSWLAAAVDSEFRPHDDLDESDRLIGAFWKVPRIHLDWGVALQAAGQAEVLQRPRSQLEGTRLHWAADVVQSDWIEPGLGWELLGGVRALEYQDLSIDDARQDPVWRSTSLADASLASRWRIQGLGLTCMAIPRAGLHLVSQGRGEDLPHLDFGDGGDTLEEDRQLAYAGIDAWLAEGGPLVDLSFYARWGLRPIDLVETSPDGQRTWRGDNALVDLVGHLATTVGTRIRANADGSYDAIRERFGQVDTLLGFQATRRLELILQLMHRPDDNDWRIGPGFQVSANRWRFSTQADWLDDALESQDPHDLHDPIHFQVRLERRFVEGSLGLRLDRLREDDGSLDHRIVLTFTSEPWP